MNRSVHYATPRRLLLGIAFALTACDAGGTPSPQASPTPIPAPPTATSSAVESLVAAAKQEGVLVTMALPHTWCNYGGVLEGFKKKYGIPVTELDPDANSSQEMSAIREAKADPNKPAPDVLDIGPSFGEQGQQEGLLLPYKVSYWDSIPTIAKQTDGYWYGSYYGVLAIQTNASVVKQPPQDWNDLLKPEYKNQIALGGDPRGATQAASAVYASALAAQGSLDDVTPGLAFFAKLYQQGNLLARIPSRDLFVAGETPIMLRWDYNALTDRDALEGKTSVVVAVPASGVIAGVYAQAISATTKHPNAAKLWEEYLYSDEGQLLLLAGYCHPIRYNDLARANAIPANLAARLPPAQIYTNARFPTVDQFSKAQTRITQDWDRVVGADIK